MLARARLLEQHLVEAETGLSPDAEPEPGSGPETADGGYEGAGHGVYVPVRQPRDGTELSDGIRTYSKFLRGLRFQGERGFALLFTRWKALARVTMSPSRIGDLMRAAVVLTQFEHKMVWR